MIPIKSFPTSTCPLSCQALPYLNLPLTPKKYPRKHPGIDVHTLQFSCAGVNKLKGRLGG